MSNEIKGTRLKKSSERISTLAAGLNACAEAAGLLREKGWAESSAGNISLRLSRPKRESLRPFRPSSAVELPRAYPELAGECLLLTLSGARMHDVARDPAAHTILLLFPDDGTGCRSAVAGRSASALYRPTSELQTHLAVQSRFVKSGAPERAVIHTHADSLIALTHHPGFKNRESINRTLRSMLPEVLLFLPRGVGYLPYHRTGSDELARATAEAAMESDVVLWEKHGVVGYGTDPLAAFDRIEIAAKAASLYLLCKNAGYEPEGLSKEQMDALRRMPS